MQKKSNGTLTWLTFDLFADHPELTHGIFLRHGGTSTGSCDSLNFSLKLSDSIQHVWMNRARAMKALGIKKLCSLSQHHGKVVTVANTAGTQVGDAMVTNRPGLGLLIQHADCQAAVFYDPIHRAVANVHCGWRGSVANIFRETVAALARNYQSKPEDLLVGISPSLGPQAAEFRHFETKLPRSFWDFQFKHMYFNFWEISRWQLERFGILPHHIEIARICTFTENKDFFSARRDRKCGCNGTIVALKSA